MAREKILVVDDEEDILEENPTLLKKYIPTNFGKNATLYVYFAGHGMPGTKKVYGYVRSHVTRESRRMQSEQTPSIVPPSDQWKDVALSRSVQ